MAWLAGLPRAVREVRVLCLMAAAGMPLAGCVPHSLSRYVPDVAPKDQVHASCTLNQHLLVAARLLVGRAAARVGIGRHDGRDFVELQFDVPEGESLQMAGDEVLLLQGSQALARARFPGISLVDNPIVNSFSDAPTLRAQQLPALSAMPGGQSAPGSPRHYWLATPIDPRGADAFELALPAVRDHTGQLHELRLRFERRHQLAFAVFNC